jgi:hypothetical protein
MGTLEHFKHKQTRALHGLALVETNSPKELENADKAEYADGDEYAALARLLATLQVQSG